MTDLCKVHGAGASLEIGAREMLPICLTSASLGAYRKELAMFALGRRGPP